MAAPAQQIRRLRRIAVLMGGLASNDAPGQIELAAFREALQHLGWQEGRNVRIEVRWPGANIEQIRAAAKELVGLDPDVILSRTTPATAAVTAETRTIAIVFTLVAEPVAAGFIENLAQPGGNITGFTNLEASLGGKWVQLLKDVAPAIARIAVLYNPITAPYAGAFLRSAEASAASLAVRLIESPVRHDSEIESAIAALAAQTGGGIVGMADSFITERKELITGLASRYRLPAIYANSGITSSGGLMSYSAVIADLFRRAGSYVDRILKGGRPGDLPTQQPTKFEFVINLKTAAALGLTVPLNLLALADEVIE